MKKDEHKTKVIFLLDKFYNDQQNNVFAYFTEEINTTNPLTFSSYAHMGQHSGCCVEYARVMKKAKPEQYAALKTELESIGYNLTILKHLPK